MYFWFYLLFAWLHGLNNHHSQFRFQAGFPSSQSGYLFFCHLYASGLILAKELSVLNNLLVPRKSHVWYLLSVGTSLISYGKSILSSHETRDNWCILCSILLGGVIPFATIFLNWHEFLTSVNKGEYILSTDYTMAVSMLMFIATSEITVVLIFLQLCAEVQKEQKAIVVCLNSNFLFW